MGDKAYNVLFLRAHNAARSIIAEVILNSEAHGRFRAFSAGSAPLGRVDSLVLELARSVDDRGETLVPSPGTNSPPRPPRPWT